jgi:hypothetical protein
VALDDLLVPCIMAQSGVGTDAKGSTDRDPTATVNEQVAVSVGSLPH